MESATLLDRFDYKLVFHESNLKELLAGLQPHFRALEVRGKRRCLYENRYFDTPDLLFFHEHHNRVARRAKVRFRCYADSSGVTFFEIKQKTNKGRTIKERLSCDGVQNTLDASMKEMLRAYLDTQTADALVPKIDNTFYRITLVDHANANRLTLDTDVSFSFDGSTADMPSVAIAELKQDVCGIQPWMRDLFHACGLREMSISKYAFGSVLLQNGYKHNNFKSPIHLLNKYVHAA